tara:strand:- start:112 stop:468 length:357 start_codon:yes stop_codon:yes gene_type:complete
MTPTEKYAYITTSIPNEMEEDELGDYLKGDFKTTEGLPVYLCEKCPTRIQFSDRHTIRFGEYTNGMNHRPYFGVFCSTCNQNTGDGLDIRYTWDDINSIYNQKIGKKKPRIIKAAHKG